jgi:uncharacterized membrane protein YgcG
MSGTNSLFNANPFGNWQGQPQNALAPVNDASAVNSIYNVNTASPQGTFYGEPGYQYPTTAQPQAAAPAAPQAAPAPPQAPTYTSPYPASPAYQAAYNTQMGLNQNVYGTTDTAKLGMLGTAGFPLYTDPRLMQDRLAQTYQAGGPDAQAAYDELMRQFAQASGGGGYGGGTGGGTSGGGSGGHGQDASGQW